MPLHDKKKINVASWHTVAIYTRSSTVEQSNHIEQVTKEGLGNVADRLLVQVESVCLQQPQRWRKRQHWSSWQVEEENYRLRLRQEQRRCPFFIEGPFFVRRLHCGRLGIPLPRGESGKWQALFCDFGLLRLAVRKNVWAYACRHHDFGYLLVCLLLACLLYDWRHDRRMAAWLICYSHSSAPMVSFPCVLSAIRLSTTQLLAYSTTSPLDYPTIRCSANM